MFDFHTKYDTFTGQWVYPPFDTSAGSPYDRGSNARYYGRHWVKPHKVVDGDNIELTDPEELRSYKAGWDEETDRKEY